MRNLIYLFFGAILLGSCVTPKIHNNLLNEYENVKQSLINEEQTNLNLQVKIEEADGKIKKLNITINRLKNDSTKKSEALLSLKSCNCLKKLYFGQDFEEYQ